MVKQHGLVAFLMPFLFLTAWAQDTPLKVEANEESAAKSVVRGRAFYEDNGMPVRRGLIGLVSIDNENFPKDPNLYIQNPLGPEEWFITQDDGSFEIKAIKSGKYYVSVNVPNVLNPQSINQFFGGHRNIAKNRLDDLFTQIEIDGINKFEIQVPVKRGSSIAGNVLHYDNVPAVGVPVELFRQPIDHAEDSVISVRKLSTDDRGYFRFTDLLPGTYFVSVTEFADHVNSNRVDSFTTSRGSELKTYFPNARELSTAEGIEVGWGTPVDGIRIEIPVKRLHTISGVVLANDTQKPVSNGIVSFERITNPETDTGFFEGNYENRVFTGDDGVFTFKDLPSGKYRLRASMCESYFCGDVAYAYIIKEIEIANTDLKDVFIELPLAATISGIVYSKETGDSAPRSVNLGIIDDEKKRQFSGWARTSKNAESEKEGTKLDFKLVGVSAGNFRFAVSIVGDHIVRRIFVGKDDVTNQSIAISEGQKIDDVRIELTNETAIFRGRVLDRNNRPAVSTTILLVPADRSKQGSFVSYFQARSDLNGEFEIKAAPGEYLITFPTRSSNRLASENWLDTISPTAEKVTLTYGKPTVRSLTFPNPK